MNKQLIIKKQIFFDYKVLRFPSVVFSMLLIIPSYNILADDCIEARDLLRKALRIEDNSTVEKEHYEKATTKCPGLFEAHYNLGLLHLRLEEFEAARKAFDSALALKAEDIDTLLAKAALEVAQHNLEAARMLYSQVLDRVGNSFIALQGLGVVLSRLNQTERAINLLEKAEVLNPDDLNLLSNIAAIYEQEENYQKAIIYYDKITDRDASNWQAWFRKGVLYDKLEELGSSVAALEQAQKLAFDSHEIHTVLGVVYQKLGDLDRAEVVLRRSLALDPKNIDTLVQLSSVLIKQKQPALAVDLLNQVLESDSKNFQALIFLGLAYMDLGNNEQAISNFERALSQDNQNIMLLNQLGLAYFRLGKLALARENFAAVLEYDSSNQLAKSYLDKIRD